MSQRERDAAAVRVPPPLVYLAGVLLGVGAHGLLWPLPLGDMSPGQLAGAAAIALAGIAALGAAAFDFRRTGQDPKPWKSTPEMLTGGIYSRTRNPMYVGMAIIQAAFAVGFANLWILATLPIVLVTVHYTAIRHEEAYLEAKFGQAYRDYKTSVRRWI